LVRKHVWVPSYTGKEGYLHAEDSDVSGYKQWKDAYPDGVSATEENASMGATGEIQVGSNFITAPLGDNVTLENSNWYMAIWSYLTGGTAYLRAKIYRYRDGVETLLFTTSDSPAVGTSYSKIVWVYQAVGTFELLSTDRLVVKIFANRTVKSAGKKIYIAYDHSTRDSLVVDPSVVGTSTATTATSYPFQRKSFYANGRFWVFYCKDGSNMVYCTSTDGSTWTSPTTVRAASYGDRFSVWFDGTYLHYAYASASSIYYRRGTPNSDGSITWSADEQTVSTTYNTVFYPMVSVDSNGYVWIGYRDYDNVNLVYYPYVIKSGNNDGTWGTGTITQLSTTNNSGWRVSIVPLTSGKMLAVYAYNGATVRAKKWDGSAWGTEVATTSVIYNGYSHSAVAQGDDVHLTFLKSTGYDILYVKYTYSSNSFGSETTLQATATSTSAPVLSIDTSTNDLYVFAATTTTGTPSGWTANHIYYIKYTASTSSWGSWTDWIDETTEVLYAADRFTCFYKAYGDKIGLEYMTKTASPYNVKFAYLSITAQQTYTKTYTVDVLFKKLGITKTYTADTLFQKQNITKTYTIDAILKKIGLKEYQIDALLQKLGIPKTYTIDSLFKKRDITTTYNIDTLLKKLGLTKNYTIDALLKKLGLTKDYPIDSLFKKLGVTKTYTVDTIFQAQGVNTYTKTYTIDALLKKLGLKQYQIDVLFQKLGLTKTYTVDSTFVLRKTKTYTLDTLLKKLNITHSYTIDTIIGQPTPEAPFGGGFPFWWEKAETWAPTLFKLFRQERAYYQTQIQLARKETVKIPAQIQLAKPSQTMIQAKPVLTARKSSFKTEIHPVLARKEKAEAKGMFKTAEPAITIIPAEIEMFTYPEIVQAVKSAKKRKVKK